jgi:imidazolonepropionase-like amidohydrolase
MYIYPAESLLQELEIYQEAGSTPLQILQAATVNGALYFRVLNEKGTIEVGKRADLVLLNENPLKDVRALRSVHTVITRGTLYNRSQLDALLAHVQDEKLRLDKERK